MIKVRLVPDFFFVPDDSQDNYVYEKGDEKRAFFIECELPCVPEKDSIIAISGFKEEIFNQYSRMLLKINHNINNAVKCLRACLDNEDYNDCEYLREKYPGLSNASNIDILRTVMNQECCENAYNGDGLVCVRRIVCIPNDEYVYILVEWKL